MIVLVAGAEVAVSAAVLVLVADAEAAVSVAVVVVVAVGAFPLVTLLLLLVGVVLEGIAAVPAVTDVALVLADGPAEEALVLVDTHTTIL